MKFLSSPANIAGALALITGAAMLPFWYIYFYVATPTRMSVGEAALSQLRYDFSADSPIRWHLAMQAIVPLVLAVIGIQYLRGKAQSQLRAVLHVSILAVAAAGALVLNYWELAILLAAMLYYGVQCARGALYLSEDRKRE